jgi:arylsulfatase A-like enzyme
VRFDRAYCNYPVCNASRTSLLSGRRPETTRVLNNATPPRTHLGDSVAFLPEWFRRHGYFTARVGKVLHRSCENSVKWDISESAAGRDRRRAEAAGEALAPQPTGNADADEPDGATARRIAQLLEENLGRSVRTERYRCTEWDSENVAELYDHPLDPHEWTNLATDPQHAALLADLRGVLRGSRRKALPELVSILFT